MHNILKFIFLKYKKTHNLTTNSFVIFQTNKTIKIYLTVCFIVNQLCLLNGRAITESQCPCLLHLWFFKQLVRSLVKINVRFNAIILTTIKLIVNLFSKRLIYNINTTPDGNLQHHRLDSTAVVFNRHYNKLRD